MSNSTLFSEALTDVKTLMDSLKKKAEMEVIKENEEKINKIFQKLLENDDTENVESNPSDNNTIKTDSITSTDISDNNDDQINNTDFIDSILNDIEISDIISQSDVEVEYKDVENDDSDDDTISSEIDDEELDINELNEYIEKTNMDNQIKKENQKLNKEEIKSSLKEIEEIIIDDEDMGDSDGDDNDHSYTGLDEEDQAFLDELSTMTEEELSDMLSEIEMEDSEESIETITEDDDTDEMDIDLDDLEDILNDDLEEGISVTTQTQKTVGSSASQQRQGYPERRSNISEETVKEFEKLKKLTNTLLEENKKLKETNNDCLKRLETLKNKLYEATVVSHKTSFVNQLLFEHSLNQKQKSEIIEKLSLADTIEESKNVFKTLKEGFANKKVLRESIEDKITKTVVGGEVSKITETKLYHQQTNPFIQKMIEQINYDPKKV